MIKAFLSPETQNRNLVKVFQKYFKKVQKLEFTLSLIARVFSIVQEIPIGLGQRLFVVSVVYDLVVDVTGLGDDAPVVSTEREVSVTKQPDSSRCI